MEILNTNCGIVTNKEPNNIVSIPQVQLWFSSRHYLANDGNPPSSWWEVMRSPGGVVEEECEDQDDQGDGDPLHAMQSQILHSRYNFALLYCFCFSTTATDITPVH